MMTTEATRQQSTNYGCIVQEKDSGHVSHYVEKPSTFVSTFINCGVYIFSTDLFPVLASIFDKNQQDYFR